jgi:hypothetical protein
MTEMFRGFDHCFPTKSGLKPFQFIFQIRLSIPRFTTNATGISVIKPRNNTHVAWIQIRRRHYESDGVGNPILNETTA